jgi:uncharacterized membrane protein YphA (DoxX/SURF4 family)
MNIKERLDSVKEYGPTIVRIAMSLVFFWFAINQLMTPSDWIGYLPTFLANTANPIMFIYANAIFEIIFGGLLILGVYTRIAALLLGLHLIGISIALGYNAIAIRDFGLAFATLSIVLNGSDKLCLRK